MGGLTCVSPFVWQAERTVLLGGFDPHDLEQQPLTRAKEVRPAWASNSNSYGSVTGIPRSTHH